MQQYVDAFAEYFDQRPVNLAYEYKWPRGKKSVPFDKTFENRKELSRKFKAEPQSRRSIAIEMVRDWGGIRTGKISAIEQMSNQTPEQLIALGLWRISSWSKVIVLHDPEKYLIFDARVAFSINQILQRAEKIVTFFPTPPSRNSYVRAASLHVSHKKTKALESETIKGQHFYIAYLALIQAVAQSLGMPGWQLEMALFARAPLLALEAGRC